MVENGSNSCAERQGMSQIPYTMLWSLYYILQAMEIYFNFLKKHILKFLHEQYRIPSFHSTDNKIEGEYAEGIHAKMLLSSM